MSYNYKCRQDFPQIGIFGRQVVQKITNGRERKTCMLACTHTAQKYDSLTLPVWTTQKLHVSLLDLKGEWSPDTGGFCTSFPRPVWIFKNEAIMYSFTSSDVFLCALPYFVCLETVNLQAHACVQYKPAQKMRFYFFGMIEVTRKWR